jgi:hypothetical protein
MHTARAWKKLPKDVRDRVRAHSTITLAQLPYDKFGCYVEKEQPVQQSVKKEQPVQQPGSPIDLRWSDDEEQPVQQQPVQFDFDFDEDD